MVLFVGELQMDVEILIWDLFFIKGFNVMFRIALTVLKLQESEILKLNSFSEIVDTLSSICSHHIDRSTLLENLAAGLDSREINTLRAIFRS